MPSVTDIKTQQRRQDRVSIYLDGKYAFSLSAPQLMDSGLSIGSSLTTSEVARLLALSDLGKAIDRVYNLLSYRERSQKEIYDYLLKQRYDEDTIAAVVEHFAARNLLDDKHFASAWVEDRQRLAHHSHRRLQAELRAKGVDSDTISQALAGLPPDSEADALKRLISQRRLRQRYPDRQKLTAYLSGKGFGYDLIKTVLADMAASESLD